MTTEPIDPVFTATQASALRQAMVTDALEARRRRMEDASGDLLAALRETTKRVHYLSDHIAPLSECRAWICEQARAAIARATKEEP